MHAETFEASRGTGYEVLLSSTLNGDPTCDFYIVCRGALEAVGAAGERLGTVKEGNCFGEMALLLGQPRSAMVRVDSPCDLLVLDALMTGPPSP